MHCPNCGEAISENENFCKSCGTRIRPIEYNSPNNIENNNTMSFQQNNQYNYHSQFQNINQTNENYKTELIDSYIGKNADKIKSGKFSWTTLFFGMLYVLYRKMWLLGLIWFFLSIIIAIFSYSNSDFSYSGIISVIVNIIVAIIFNKLYLNKAEEKVDKIIKENQNKSKDELKAICSKKGGTTIIPVIIILVLYSIIIINAVNITLNDIDDSKLSATKSEAIMIVAGVNNHCAAAEMKQALDGTPNPCSDGVSISEVPSMADTGNATIIDIRYDKKVRYLKIKSNGIIIEYDGSSYKRVKK